MPDHAYFHRFEKRLLDDNDDMYLLVTSLVLFEKETIYREHSLRKLATIIRVHKVIVACKEGCENEDGRSSKSTAPYVETLFRLIMVRRVRNR